MSHEEIQKTPTSDWGLIILDISTPQLSLKGVQPPLVGNLVIKGKKVVYTVGSIKDITPGIIPPVIQYPLFTQKRADFELFKLVIDLINQKEHLTSEGLHKIISVKASINRGLSDTLIDSFPNIQVVDRPVIETTEIPNPNWVAGFSAAESCFDFNIIKKITAKLGYQTQLRFIISQHVRDRALLGLIVSYLNCGTIQTSRDTVEFYVSGFNDIINIIIPFFNKYPLHGAKALDYADFCKVAQLMQDKAHLTKEGLDKIRKIKAGMNTGR